MKTKELIPNVDVPEGQSGIWKVERFTIENDVQFRLWNLRAMRDGRGVVPGEYTRLTRNGEVIMSDTTAEKNDHRWPVLKAEGTILINGLGLGMVLNACLLKPEVTKAVVVEKSPDVIALVAAHYRKKFPGRVEIVEADAFEYEPPKRAKFMLCWHDVWDSICADNLPDMKRLHRKYGRRTIYQGSWGRELCEDSNRRGGW